MCVCSDLKLCLLVFSLCGAFSRCSSFPPPPRVLLVLPCVQNFLYDEDEGTFLVRVSERANGYAISIKFNNRVNHYKISHSDKGGYVVLGAEEDFGDLEELVDFYRENDLSQHKDRLVEPLYMEHDLGLDIGMSSIKGASEDKVKSYDPNFTPRNQGDDEDESKLEPLEVEDYLECGDGAKPSWCVVPALCVRVSVAV